VVVDEMADLMLIAGKEIETSIQRLAQMAPRGGHSYHHGNTAPVSGCDYRRDSKPLPTRVSFQVTSRMTAAPSSNEQGAEQLLGKANYNMAARAHHPRARPVHQRQGSGAASRPRA